MAEHVQDPGRAPVRLIASDLDGTVLGPDFRFRPRTLEAIAAARDAGIQVVFVTGRPKRWLDPLHEQLDDVGVVICSNGAVVFDPGSCRSDICCGWAWVLRILTTEKLMAHPHRLRVGTSNYSSFQSTNPQ